MSDFKAKVYQCRVFLSCSLVHAASRYATRTYVVSERVSGQIDTVSVKQATHGVHQLTVLTWGYG